MTKNERIFRAVASAIDDMNQERPVEDQLQKDPDTPLYGKCGVLNSLGLVSLIVAIQRNIEREFGETITLADEKALSQKDSPFSSIGSLAQYISTLLKNNVTA